MSKLTNLNEYAPYINANNKETECRNRISVLEQEIQELRNSQNIRKSVPDPEDLDSIVESANTPNLNDKIVILSNQQSALKKILPTLEERTIGAKREFNYALAKQHQSKFTELETAVADAYIKLQSAAKKVADFEREIFALAQDDVAFAREVGSFYEFIPDPNSTVQRDFYRAIDVKRLPENIKKVFGHIAREEAA